MLAVHWSAAVEEPFVPPGRSSSPPRRCDRAQGQPMFLFKYSTASVWRLRDSVCSVCAFCSPAAAAGPIPHQQGNIPYRTPATVNGLATKPSNHNKLHKPSHHSKHTNHQIAYSLLLNFLPRSHWCPPPPPLECGTQLKRAR